MDEKIYEGMTSYAQNLRDELEELRYCENPEYKEMREQKVHARYMDAFDRSHQVHHSEMEFYDKSNRLDLEERRMELQAELDRLKMGFDWKKAGLEISKVLLPMAGSSILLITALRSSYDIEKDGRINSKFSNIVYGQIPRSWK